jgi:putative ABC transport system permease protein
MNRQSPPKWPLRFFRWFCHPDYVEDIEGDLLERFEKRSNEKKAAKWLLAMDVIRLFRPGIIKNFEGTQQLNNYGMIRHFVLVAVRGFKKDKSYTVINLISLTVSICVSLLIWQYVLNQKQYDKFHDNLEDKYRVNYSYFQNDELQMESALTTFGLGPEVVENLSGIKNMVRIRPIFSDEGLVISNKKANKRFLEFNAYYVENSFLEFFNYPLESGSLTEALYLPNNIVLTQKSARKFFGDENPMGKTLHISGGSLSGDFIVSGLLKELPAGTHLDFDYLIPINFLLTHYGLYTREEGWHWSNFYTYFELKKGTGHTQLASLLDELIDEKIGHDLQQTDQTLKASFQPVSSIYLDPTIDGDSGLYKGNKANIVIFTIVAIVLLLVAGINYINLASARALKKKFDVSLRRAIGATKQQLLAQFLFESFLLNLLAIVVSLILATLLTPTFGQLIGSDMQFSLIHEMHFWIITLVAITFFSLLTGLYPALLSLRLGRNVSSRNQTKPATKIIFFRKSLTVFQLAISLAMVAGTWLVYHQVSYMKGKELGVEMDQLFVVQGPRVVIEEGREIMKIKQDRFKNTLLSNPSIQVVSGTSNIPATGAIWNGGIRKLGDARDQEKNAETIFVDKEFTKAYDFEFLAGGPFDEGMLDYEAVIINESALISIGLKDPNEALFHSIIMEDMDTLKIHGVVRDIHWNSLHEPISPTIFGILDYPAFFTIKLNASNLQATLELVANTYQELYPNDPYISFFLDDEFNQQYESEQKFGQVFSLFAIIAIIISSLGLFAMIAYSLSQKVKEIGIRKVLGASAIQLFKLLSKEYFQVYLVAIVLSTPLIFFGAANWLNNYAYRITIGPKLLVIPIVLIGVITFLVIVNKILISMKIDPAKQLRDE